MIAAATATRGRRNLPHRAVEFSSGVRIVCRSVGVCRLYGQESIRARVEQEVVFIRAPINLQRIII